MIEHEELLDRLALILKTDPGEQNIECINDFLKNMESTCVFVNKLKTFLGGKIKIHLEGYDRYEGYTYINIEFSENYNKMFCNDNIFILDYESFNWETCDGLSWSMVIDDNRELIIDTGIIHYKFSNV